MPGEILRNITAASIVGCAAMMLVRNGPLKEILRITLGILIILAVVRPFSGNISMFDRDLFADNVISMDELVDEQEMIYSDALSHTAEAAVEDYFRKKDREVDAVVQIVEGEIRHIILCPLGTYDWTQNDMEEFTVWSGIPEEKQEWIWN